MTCLVPTTETADARFEDGTSLRDSVLACLRNEPGWNALTCGIHVWQGMVVLQGIAPLRSHRHAARWAVEAVPGVQGVWDARVPISA